MSICENCGKEHDGSYGSGRFCSEHCRRSYNGKQNKGKNLGHPSYNGIIAKKEGWTCNACGEKFRTRRELQEHRKKVNHSRNYFKICYCKYCGKKSTSLTGNAIHEKYCIKNPDKQIFIGHVCDDTTRNKISNSMKQAHKELRHPGWASSKHEDNKSYPEIWLTSFLNEFCEGEYSYNYPFKRWKLDFAFIEKKKCIEIDGGQHLEESQHNSDIMKDNALLEEGWSIFRISWVDLISNISYYKEKIKNFIKNDSKNIYEKYYDVLLNKSSYSSMERTISS